MVTENGLNIAVCDDVEADRQQTLLLAREILERKGIRACISTYESAKALLDAVHSGAKFNILLLDVLMEDMDGMELAEHLRARDDKVEIIFISINREMALRGYEVSAARYLAKPLDAGKLEEALGYCLRRCQERKDFLLPTNQGQHRTSFSDIQFVEAFERGTRFVLDGEMVETRLKFSEAEELLPKSAFLQCHRAYIVNIAYIKRIRPYEFEMRSGAAVPISKYRYQEINKRFMDCIAD